MRKALIFLVSAVPNFCSLSMALFSLALSYKAEPPSWLAPILYFVALLGAIALGIFISKRKSPRPWIGVSWTLLIPAFILIERTVGSIPHP